MVEVIEIETSDHRVGRSGIGYRRLFLIKQGKFAGTGLSESFGIMFDSAGNIYAVKRDNDTIEKFLPRGRSRRICLDLPKTALHDDVQAKPPALRK